ncbi:hypothetical protein [Sphingomonas sp. ERG5]|uniref:hypothetical protein n=1 Tax=Sphingomonas sp. ERG5 TaxID=1381597 RepID=UPI00126A32CC|nr:hypothetical protein [Sphingomonas sp. ERG5]
MVRSLSVAAGITVPQTICLVPKSILREREDVALIRAQRDACLGHFIEAIKRKSPDSRQRKVQL